jgi:hypothetical protein
MSADESASSVDAGTSLAGEAMEALEGSDQHTDRAIAYALLAIRHELAALRTAVDRR